MNKIFKSLLWGFTLPLTMAMGSPNKWKTDKYKREVPGELKFGADGKFRILHLTDIHNVDPAMDDDENTDIPRDKDIETINCIEKCVEQTKPDLVVFGGDNISGFWEEFTYEYIEKTIKRIIEPIVKRNIPLAVVFGNHDGEAGFYTEFQMLMYMNYENCRSNLNDADVFGCGNCNITVKSSDEKRDALSIFLMDSGDYVKMPDGKFGYNYVHKDQIEWYENKSRELKEKNGGKPVPAVLFQHMPVQQELDLLKEVPKKGDNTIEHDGKFYSFGENLISGRLRERPCPPAEMYDHREQLLSWKKCGDVFAAFFGHDHVNDFCVEYDEIKLYQTIGCGYFTYGKEHGGRLMVFDENNPRDFVTETIEIPRITETEF